jgi:hypothetical protein
VSSTRKRDRLRRLTPTDALGTVIRDRHDRRMLVTLEGWAALAPMPGPGVRLMIESDGGEMTDGEVSFDRQLNTFVVRLGGSIDGGDKVIVRRPA